MKRFLMAILSVIMVMTLGINSTYCLDTERAREWYESGSDDYTDLSLWGQASDPRTEGRYLQCGRSDASVWNNACSYYAASFMLAKMGVLDVSSGENPVTVLDKMEAVDPVGEMWGIMNYSKIDLAFPTVHLVPSEFDRNLLGFTHEEIVHMIRAVIEEGGFVIVCAGEGCTPGGHYIFIDDVTEDGDLIIGDSFYEGRKWSDTFGPSGSRIYYWDVFWCEDCVPADCPSIYDIHDIIMQNRMEEDIKDQILDMPESVNAIRLEQFLRDEMSFDSLLV